MLNYEKNNSTLAYSIKTGQELTIVPTNAILSGNPKAINALSKNIKSIHENNVLNGTVGSLNPLTTQQQSELKAYWDKAKPGTNYLFSRICLMLVQAMLMQRET